MAYAVLFPIGLQGWRGGKVWLGLWVPDSRDVAVGSDVWMGSCAVHGTHSSTLWSPPSCDTTQRVAPCSVLGQKRKYFSFAGTLAVSLSCKDLAEQKKFPQKWMHVMEKSAAWVYFAHSVKKKKIRGGKSCAVWGKKHTCLNVTCIVNRLWCEESTQQEGVCFAFSGGSSHCKQPDGQTQVCLQRVPL